MLGCTHQLSQQLVFVISWVLLAESLETTYSALIAVDAYRQDWQCQYCSDTASSVTSGPDLHSTIPGTLGVLQNNGWVFTLE